MEFNRVFVHNVTSIFNNLEQNHNYFLDKISLDKNNVFGKSLIVELNNDEIEIPIIARRHIEEIIKGNKIITNIKNIDKVVIELYENVISIERKSFNKIIDELFVNTSFNDRLKKITTSKGEVYYGSKGLIFDEDYTPLLLCTLAAKTMQVDGRIDKFYYRPICHINPKVFLEPNKIVNRGIIKKLIPCYTNTPITFPTNIDALPNNIESHKVKVIVDDFSRFFINPVKPTPSTDFNDILNECLVDNIEDVLSLI